MHKETVERRDFLPDFVARVASRAGAVVVETGIGSGMGLADADYCGSGKVRSADNAAAFAQDVVVVLRSPELDEFSKLRRGAVVMSMLHFPTRPRRIRHLGVLGVDGMGLELWNTTGDSSGRCSRHCRSVAVRPPCDRKTTPWTPPCGVQVWLAGRSGWTGPAGDPVAYSAQSSYSVTRTAGRSLGVARAIHGFTALAACAEIQTPKGFADPRPGPDQPRCAVGAVGRVVVPSGRQPAGREHARVTGRDLELTVEGPVAYAVARRHGGWIEVEPGAGTGARIGTGWPVAD